MKSQNVALCAPSWKKIYGSIIEMPTETSQNSWQGHCKHGLYDREAEGACSSGTDWREELLHCLWSAQGDLNLKYISTFDQCVSSSASPAMGLPCRILRSLPWGCCWSARQSLCSRGEKYLKLSKRSTNRCSGLPGRGLGSSHRRFELPRLFSGGPGHSWSRLAKCPSILLHFNAI